MKFKRWLSVWCVAVLSACVSGGSTSHEAEQTQSSAVKTEIVQRDGRHVLLRDGKPYQIKGAGIEVAELDQFVRNGGNSFRNWTTGNAKAELDYALQRGLTVSLCLNVDKERYGFDYNDSDAVAAQLERIRTEVEQYRDHPALLSWIIGNEANYDATNLKVYDAINEVSMMIHELDPNHPTTTALAGFDADLVKEINRRAPDLDYLSFQLYGDLANLPKYLKESDFRRPYMVTEWGTIGHWEMPKTTWGAPLEQNSSEKADNHQKMFEEVISSPSRYNIGAYVFFWGQKQERTPTWYGLFLESGEATEAVDVMHRAWTGEWPENRTPRLDSVRLNSLAAKDNVVLEAGESYLAEVRVADPDGDPLRYHWEVRLESTATQVGGDKEEKPPVVAGALSANDHSEVHVLTPTTPGAYRLFVYAFDGQGHAAHANIPFLVES